MVKEREAWRAAVHGVAESDSIEQLSNNHHQWLGSHMLHGMAKKKKKSLEPGTTSRGFGHRLTASWWQWGQGGGKAEGLSPEASRETKKPRWRPPPLYPSSFLSLPSVLPSVNTSLHSLCPALCPRLPSGLSRCHQGGRQCITVITFAGSRLEERSRVPVQVSSDPRPGEEGIRVMKTGLGSV